jgi:outer membrane protein assembly factor BamB
MKLRKQKMTTVIALLLVITIAIPFAILPITTAQDAPTKNTFPGINVVPNPVGVGQEALIMFGITHPTAWPQSGWTGLTITVTRPDNTTETLGPFETDTTGMSGRIYVPTMVGTYYFQTQFPEQPITVNAAGTSAGTIMQASTSEILEVIVQQDPIPHHPGTPLPTEYWTRPIRAQYREWSAISGSWLQATHPPNRFAPYNEGPESAHILWTKPLETGGLIGGEFEGLSFSHGDAYEGRFNNRVILNGVLYYNLYQSQGPTTAQINAGNGTTVEQNVVAVDIRTGEELWRRPLIDPTGVSRRVAFGQITYWDTMNHHGAWSYLWTTVGSTWHSFDPFTGRYEYTLTGVPSGTNTYGPNGEIIRYNINLAQNWMQKWNSTHAVYAQLLRDFGNAANPAYEAGRWRPQGRTFNASLGIEWDIALGGQPRGSGARILPGAVKIVLADRIIGSNTAWSGGAQQPNPVFWGISTAPGREGQILFNRTWTLPIADVHVDIPGTMPSSIEDGVFVVSVKETRQHYGFSLDTGQQLWGPTESEPFLNAYSNIYMDPWGQSVVAYGKLFTGGMGGQVNAYDVQTGERLWSYRVTDPYNEQVLGDWPAPIAFITDGKIYVMHMEHSVIDPRPRGAPFVALDVETGEEVFRIDGLRIGTRWGGQPLIGDSVIIGFNTYDNRIYALGKGPSATTVAASPRVAVQGGSVIIEGMVSDVSPGTKDPSLAIRFPNGVPAVADESMSAWMNYVYMQAQRPADVVGVEVTIDVIDANGNYRNIGTAASDASGFFSFDWQPDISGKYTVIATFAGSKAYHQSFAQTAFVVDEAAESPAEPPASASSPTELYFAVSTAAIIAAIAIVGLLLLKKRP